MKNVEINDFEESEVTAQAPDWATFLSGSVWMVPDKVWKITTRVDDHPGAVLRVDEAKRSCLMVKGTDARHPRVKKPHWIVEPNETNGLSKLCGFRLQPVYVRLHRVKTYYPERYLGHLDSTEVKGIKAELFRLFGIGFEP